MRVTLTLASGCYGPDAAIPASSVLHGENSYINDCTSRQVASLQAFFFFQAEDGIRDIGVTGVQTCALPICLSLKADPGAIGERNETVLDHRIVGKAREHAKHTRITLRAAEAEAGRDGERHQIGRASCRERV